MGWDGLWEGFQSLPQEQCILEFAAFYKAFVRSFQQQSKVPVITRDKVHMTSQHKTSGHWVELRVATIQRALVKLPSVVAVLAGWMQFDCSFWQTSVCVCDVQTSGRAGPKHNYPIPIFKHIA